MAAQPNNILAIKSREELAALAVALGAQAVPGWSEQEKAFVKELPTVDLVTLAELHQSIAEGQDPLGELFCQLPRGTPPSWRSLYAFCYRYCND